MRAKIISALVQSRLLVRDQVELQACSHNGHYAPDTSQCRYCVYGLECKWLYENDEFVALEQKAMGNLVEALQFAEAYVDAITMPWGHNRRNCHCELCRWLRHSRRLLRKADD